MSAAAKLHRFGPKTVAAQTAEITKCHVMFIVFFKFSIEITFGDGINQFLLKIGAFGCTICLCSCSEQKGCQFLLYIATVGRLSLISITPESGTG